MILFNRGIHLLLKTLNCLPSLGLLPLSWHSWLNNSLWLFGLLSDSQSCLEHYVWLHDKLPKQTKVKSKKEEVCCCSFLPFFIYLFVVRTLSKTFFWSHKYFEFDNGCITLDQSWYKMLYFNCQLAENF